MPEERYVPGVSFECPNCKRWTTGREGITACKGCGRLYSVVVMLVYESGPLTVEVFA